MEEQPQQTQQAHEPDAFASRKSSVRKARAAISDPRAAAAHALKSITPQLRRQKAAARRKEMGPIDRAKSYPKDKFLKLSGMGSSAWHKAVNPDDKSKPKLTVVNVSGKLWVTGEDYYEYLRELGEWQRKESEEFDAQNSIGTKSACTENGTEP